MASNVSWGIELGASAVKAVKLEGAAGDGVNLLDFAVVPHKKVLSTPEIDQTDAIRIALGTLAGQVDFSGANIAVSVPGHSAFARFAKLPPVEPKKVPDIVKFEAVQQIPFALEEVEWDYQTFVSPNSPDIEVGIFAIKSQQVREHLALFEDAGIIPDTVTLSPVAVYNALAYDFQFTEKTEGTVVLDVGTTSTDLIVADSGRVWVRTFPIGGHHFTEALVEKFNLSYGKAEKLKREAAANKHANHVFQAMRPVYGDLAQDVQRSVGYYQSLHPDADISRVIGVGSTFNLPGMRRFLKQQLSMNVYRLEEFKRIEGEGPQDIELKRATPNLATAYGLALQGLDRATLQANLMPVVVIKRAMWRRKIKWFGVAAGLSAAAGVAMQLRPFFDQNRIDSNQPNPVISEASTRANRLKNEAGDLIQAPPQNFHAVNLIGLTKGRETYPRIVADVGDLLNMANESSGAGSSASGATFLMESLDIEYLGPGGEGTKPRVKEDTGRLPDIWDTEEQTPEGPMEPKLSIDLRLTTGLPPVQAQTVAAEVTSRWLAEAAERPGVPYRVENLRWELTEFVAGTETAERMTTDPSTGEIVAGPGPGERGERGGRGPGRRGPRGAQAGTTVVGGSSSNVTQVPEAAAALHSKAPLPQIPPVHDPSKDVQKFRITWDVILGEKKEEGAG
jgi:type IV pilus assembly protein PilM